MSSSRWTIIEHRGEGGLRSLRSDWERLYDAMPLRASYHAYESHLAYLSHLNPAPDRFRYLALTDGHSVRAVCPLEARTDRVLGLPVRVWGLPLHPHWALTDVVCPEDDARQRLVPALVDYLRRAPGGRRLLVLGPLPQSSVIWDGLAEMHRSDYFVHPSRASDVFDCSKSYDELLSRLSKHFRRNLRSARKKLDLLGDVRFVTASSVCDLLREFDSFVEVEGSGWKGASGTGSAIRLHPELIGFYRELAAELGAAGRCEINALYADGRCLAAQFCVRTGEECAILKIGYDEGYGRVAPGLMLLQRTLERCCGDQAIARLSLVTDGPWQRDWHPEVIPTRQAHLALHRWLGIPLVELLRFRYGYGRRIVRWLRSKRQEPADARAARRSGA